MRHCAKFRADRSNHCRVMAVFDFLIWWPSASSGYSKFENLTNSPVRRANLRHRAKFCADR